MAADVDTGDTQLALFADEGAQASGPDPRGDLGPEVLKAVAAGLVGANTATAARSTPIPSITLAFGIAVCKKPGTSRIR